jgi:hypothetical protein
VVYTVLHNLLTANQSTTNQETITDIQKVNATKTTHPQNLLPDKNYQLL